MPDLQVSPRSARLDQQLTIVVRDVDPHAEVLVRAAAIDGTGQAWLASATFVADARGVVDVSRTAPVSGDYRGVNALGLIETLAPDEPWPVPSLLTIADGFRVQFSASSGGEKSEPAVAVRANLKSGTSERVPSEDTGLVGRFYAPPSERTLGAVLLLGGTEGGTSMRGVAALLSGHGFATLALAYSAAPGLPKRSERIPLEYFARGLDWLRAQPEVDPERVAILGVSAGATAAMLIAADDAKVAATVAWSGSAVPLPVGSRGRIAPAWTRNGEDVPGLGLRSVRDVRLRELFAVPRALLQMRRAAQADVFAALADGVDLDTLAVPLERASGPVMLLHGGADNLIATKFVEAAVPRLRRRTHEQADEVVVYPAAGHIAPRPGAPFPPVKTKSGFSRSARHTGGTPEANVAAVRDAWARTLRFLAKCIGPSDPGRKVMARWELFSGPIAAMVGSVQIEVDGDDPPEYACANLTLALRRGDDRARVAIAFERRYGNAWISKVLASPLESTNDVSRSEAGVELVRSNSLHVDLTTRVEDDHLRVSIEGLYEDEFALDGFRPASVSLFNHTFGPQTGLVTTTLANFEIRGDHGEAIPLGEIPKPTGVNTQAASIEVLTDGRIRTTLEPRRDPGAYALLDYDAKPSPGRVVYRGSATERPRSR